MIQRITTFILLLLCTIFSVSANASLFGQGAKSPFLPVDQAFAFDFSQQNHQLTLSWQVQPGYYLYRQQIKISPQHAQLAKWAFPTGESHEDEFYGKTIVYPHDLTLALTLIEAKQDAQVTVTYQGCAAAGFCYPPETRTIPLSEVTATSPSAADGSRPVERTDDTALTLSEKSKDPAMPAAPTELADSARAAASSDVANTEQQLPFSPLWALLNV